MDKIKVGDLLFHDSAGLGMVVKVRDVAAPYEYVTWWSGAKYETAFTVEANKWNIEGWKMRLAQYMKENWDAKAKAHQ